MQVRKEVALLRFQLSVFFFVVVVLLSVFSIFPQLSKFFLCADYLSVEDFPEHIKSLVQKEKESEEQEKRQREIERNTCKVSSRT